MYSSTKKYHIWSTENTNLMLMFILTIILVYLLPRLGLPQLVSRTIFLILTVVVFRSKQDYFWLAWFFVTINAPGRLFNASASTTLFRLPLYNIISGISLSFPEIFLIMYSIKFFARKQREYFLFGTHFRVILIYAIFVFFYSLFLGMTFANMIFAVRSIMPWIWLIIVPEFISDTHKIDRVMQLLFPFVYLSLILTIQTQLTGTYLHNILSGEHAQNYLGEVEETLIRVSHSSNLVFICTMMSIFYSTLGKKHFTTTYLYSIISLSAVMTFMGATRGWLIAFFVLLSSYLFMGGMNVFKQFSRLAVILGFFIIAIGSLYPAFYFQTSEAFDRFMTMEQLAQGDMTAGGTLGRITERGPRVMAQFKESPIIGWGFSNHFFAFSDGHVGNQNMLLNGGVIGYFVWMLIFVIICAKIFSLSRITRVKSKIGSGGLVFFFAMLASFVIHSSSMQIWGFVGYINQATYMHWAFLLTAANVYLLSAYTENTNYSNI